MYVYIWGPFPRAECKSENLIEAQGQASMQVRLCLLAHHCLSMLFTRRLKIVRSTFDLASTVRYSRQLRFSSTLKALFFSALMPLRI